MTLEIRELEERLKALLSKADELLRLSPRQDQPVLPPAAPVECAPGDAVKDVPDIIADSAAEVPDGEKAPLLLPASSIKILLEPSPPAHEVVDLELSGQPVIILPSEGTAGKGTDPSTVDAVEPMVTGVATDRADPSQRGAEIPFLIGYPEPMLEAAKELQENLERLKPKFTKMKFYLRGRGSVPYSRDHPLQDSSFGKIRDLHGGVLLLITTHRLSNKTPHPLAAELARCGLYFQEVLSESIYKKAFYFDFLLGLVFFLKTQKATPSGADPETWNPEGTVD